jgi:hypothetical protein
VISADVLKSGGEKGDDMTHQNVGHEVSAIILESRLAGLHS